MNQAAAAIEILALDVDGVLTDGSISISDTGHELKRFHVRDGFGIRLWQRMGFKVAIITGRSGKAVQYRCEELGITDVIQGSKDKSAALDDLCLRMGVTQDRIAFMGDDWPDLSVMKRVGIAIAPSDAHPRILEVAPMVTKAPGGHGAVREAIEALLAAKGMLDLALGHYQ